MSVDSFSEAKLAVLLKLYFITMKNINSCRLSREQVVSYKPGGVSDLLTKKALNGLVEDKLVESTEEFLQNDMTSVYEISATGLTYIENEKRFGVGYVAEHFEAESVWADTVQSTNTGVESGDAVNAAGLVLSPDAPPQAGAAPQSIRSTSFGFRANFNNRNFYASASDGVPAADRYVNVRDNQPAFDQLVSRLTAITDEYARDHNHLAAERAAIEMLAEIDAVLAQIQRGVVRLGQIAHGLLPSFDNVCLALAAYPGLALAIHDAIPAAQAILTSFGFN